MKKAKHMRKRKNRLTASVAMATALAISASTPVLAEVADNGTQLNTGTEHVAPEVKDTQAEAPDSYTAEEAAEHNAKVDENLQDVADQNAVIAQENEKIDHAPEETDEEETETTTPESGEADANKENENEEEAPEPNQTIVEENTATDEANRAQIEKNEEQAASQGEDNTDPALPEIPQAPVFEGTLPEMPSEPQMDDSMSAAEKNAALEAYQQQLNAYNTLIEAYNQAVNDYNDAVDDDVRGQAATSYNAAIEAYNQTVETINRQTADEAVADNSSVVQDNQAVIDANETQDQANQAVVEANALLDAGGQEIGTEFSVTETDGTTTTVTLQLPEAPDAGLLERLTEEQRTELEQNHADAVAAYNEAVAQYKTDVEAYRTAVQQYNQAVKCYNEAVAASNQAAIEQAAAEKAEQDIEPMLSAEDAALAERAQAVRDRKAALEALEAALAAQAAPTTDEEVAAYNALVKQYNEADEEYWRAIDEYNAAATAKNNEADLANALQQATNQANAADNMQTIAQDLLAIAQVGNFAESEAGTVETTSTTDENGTTTVTTQITPDGGIAYRLIGTVQNENSQTTLTGITVEVTTLDENGQPQTQTFTLNLKDAAWLKDAEAIHFDPDAYSSYNEAVQAYVEQIAQYDADTGALNGGYNAAIEEYLQFVAQYDAAIGQYQAILNAADTSLQTVNASTLQELATKLSGNAAKDSFANAAGQTYVHVDGQNAEGTAATTNITFASADEARQYHNEVLMQEVKDAKAALEAAREAITNDGLTGANIAAYNQAVQAYNLAVTNYNNFAVMCDPEKLPSNGQTSSSASDAVDRPLYMAQNSSDAYFYILFSGTVPFETSGKSYGAQYYTESKSNANADGTVGYTSHSTMKGTVQNSTIYPSRLTFGSSNDADAKVFVENQYYPARIYRDADGGEARYYVDANGNLYTNRELTEKAQVDTAQVELVQALYVDKAGAQYTLDAQGRLCDANGNLVQTTDSGTTVQYKVVEGKGDTLYVIDAAGNYATGVSINVTVPESKDIVVNSEWNTRAFDFSTEDELRAYFENVNTAITELPTREKVADVLASSGFDDSIVQAYKDNQIDTLWYVVKTESTIHVDGVLYWKDSLEVVGREQLSKLTKLTELNASDQSGTSIGLTPLAALDVNGQTVLVLFAGSDDTRGTALKDTLGLLDDSLNEDVVELKELLEILAPLQSGLREVQPAQLPEKALYVESQLLDEVSPNLTPDEQQLMREILTIISVNITPEPTTEDVELLDEATPLVELPDEATPLAELPDEETPLVELEEPEIPLSEVPRTGDNAGIWALSALMAVGALLRKKKYHPEH